MNNPKIETDLGEIFQRLEKRFDKIDERFDKIDERFDKIDERFQKIDERFNRLEISQAEIKGEIKALDTKVDQLEKRIGNVEFSSRGILIGIGVVILGGLAMVLGIGKP